MLTTSPSDGLAPAEPDRPHVDRHRHRRRHRSRRWWVAALVAAVLASVALLAWTPAGRWLPGGGPDPADPAAMPVGDLPGWHQVFADDFDRTDLGPWWDAYDGQPAGDPRSLWQPDRVLLDGSTMTLRGERVAGGSDAQLTTGGVSNWKVSQTYGKWEVRARVDAGDDITYAFLLWPSSGDWPPEIDFLEDWGGTRQAASAFLHYKTPTGRDKLQWDVRADFTQWHTFGVEWLPGQVTFTLDGRDWATYRGAEVPDVPMWLAIQAQAGGCERRAASFGAAQCPIAGSPAVADIQVDWVVVYSRS